MTAHAPPRSCSGTTLACTSLDRPPAYTSRQHGALHRAHRASPTADPTKPQQGTDHWLKVSRVRNHSRFSRYERLIHSDAEGPYVSASQPNAPLLNNSKPPLAQTERTGSRRKLIDSTTSSFIPTTNTSSNANDPAPLRPRALAEKKMVDFSPNH